MKAKFLKPNDPHLRKTSKKIPQNKIGSEDIEAIIQTMLKIAYGEQKNKKKPIMVGLAAPQIGILKRIILVDVAADGKGRVGDLRIYINPEITWKSKKEGGWYEGCYSTGKVCGIVSRPISIEIHAFTIQGNALKAKYSGYAARIFQHEINHLDGIVFVNHIKNPDNLHLVEKKEFPLYRDKKAWRNWPKKASLPLANQASKKV